MFLTQTGSMTVVAPADRPKSVRNSCVIKRICSFCVSFYLCIFCRLEFFIVIRLRQISSLIHRYLFGKTMSYYNAYIQVVGYISLALANTNIQYKQIDYDADNIDNNR